MTSYGSAIAACARCLRTQDPGAALGMAMPVCGRPVIGGAGLRARYCQACHAVLTARVGSRPRVPSRAPNDPWLMPSEAELEEAFG